MTVDLTIQSNVYPYYTTSPTEIADDKHAFTTSTLEEAVEITNEQAFTLLEKRRFDDRAICSTAGITVKPSLRFLRQPKSRTLTHNEGITLQKIIEWDKRFVGGEKAAENKTALEKQLNAIDISKAMTEFGKLDDFEITKILIEFYNDDFTITGYTDAEDFANEVTNSGETFGANLNTIRNGLAKYFQTRANRIISRRYEQHNSSTQIYS